jgi:subtilase family serine protease
VLVFDVFRPATTFAAAALFAASLSAANAAALIPGRAAAAALSERRVHFAIAFPMRNRSELDALIAAQQDPASPIYHHWLTREQFEAGFAPSGAVRAATARELRAAGFDVNVGSQAVFAHGPQSAAERYFDTRFTSRIPEGAARPVLTPMSALQPSPLVVAQQGRVVGLDGLPDWHSNAIFNPLPGRQPHNFLGEMGPYLAPDLKQAYSFPSFAVADGKGTSIAIISSSPIQPSDIAEYFQETGEPAPTIDEFPIDGGGPFQASSGASGEVTLDVEMSGGSAPDATIGIFNIPELSSGELLEAYSDAVEAKADIVSSSIGGCEKAYDTQTGIWELESLDNVFAEGTSEGTTFVGASGDNAAYECGTGTAKANLSVQTPTDDPLMVAVGGTTQLVTQYASGSDNSAYVSETSYDSAFTGHGGSLWGSCGGYSVVWALPSYQKGFVTGKFRGVPDLAMHMGGPASTNSTDDIYVGGQWEQVSGTSAAAPEFAGLLALKVQLTKGKLGDIHSFLYTGAEKKGMFRTGIVGTNGYDTSKNMWDPVLGLGTPYGRVIVGKPTAALAGVPGTASNP